MVSVMSDEQSRGSDRRAAWRRAALCVLLGAGPLASCLFLTGCPMGAVGYMMTPEPMTTVPAEFAGLPGHKLLVLVLTRESTEFADPDLGADLSAYVEDTLKNNKEIDDLSFVSRADVRRYQETHAYWSDTPAAELGKRFGAEMVLSLSVDYFTLNLQGDAYYQQGRLTCAARLLDLSKPRGHEVVWTKDKLTVSYPPKEYGPGISSDARRTRQELLRGLSDELAKCFYKHKEPTYAEKG